MKNNQLSPLRLWLNILFASLLSLLWGTGYYIVTQLGHFDFWQLFGLGCSVIYIGVMVWSAIAFQQDMMSYAKLRFVIVGGFALMFFATMTSCYLLG